MIWYLRLLCCGREDRVESFMSWEEADAFRQSYISGPGVTVDTFANGHLGGHDRAAVLDVVEVSDV